MDVYSNPFESKLQLPKQDHFIYPFEEVLDNLFAPVTIQLLAQAFGIPLFNVSDDYFTGFFVYREGDYLQNHLDSVMHGENNRTLTANLYLTDAEFVYKNKRYDLTAGTLFVFLNDEVAYHGVYPTPSTRMLVSVGYIGGVVNTHTYKRAQFVPWPSEVWTPEQLELAKERSSVVG